MKCKTIHGGHTAPALRHAGTGTLLASVAILAAACGGGGGAGTGDTLKGVVLVDFLQASQDNVALNTTLEFRFSSEIDPSSVNPDSLQVRSGALFGSQVAGRCVIQGSTILFESNLPSKCNPLDSGLQPDVDYRVTLVGSPEEFAIRNLAGEPLQSTINELFHTRKLTDPLLFQDAIPGVAPTVIGFSPADGAYPDGPLGDTDPAHSNYPEVYVGTGGAKITMEFSENLDPCSISPDTIKVFQYATGDQGTAPNGFAGGDATPGDPFTWGSGIPTSPATRVVSDFVFFQDLAHTRLTITPQFRDSSGTPLFPDNALVVVQVTNNVKDFGGISLVPKTFAFVTQNTPPGSGARVFEFVGETPIDPLTTAAVNTATSPGLVQGFVLFSGDGDNGNLMTKPALPNSSVGPAGCTTPAGTPQANDGNQDDFDPTADIALDTGATVNTCKNSTDGSTAVVFEFHTFHIRSGIAVRLIGVNPAIILSQGDILIDAGGRLVATGDGLGTAPQANGQIGSLTNGGPTVGNLVPGGGGMAGGGKGGDCPAATTVGFSQHGTSGYYTLPPPPPGVTAPDARTVGGAGSGHGNLGVNWTTQIAGGSNRFPPSGGGGGHAVAGGNGDASNNTAIGTTPVVINAGTPDGAGGIAYGFSNMLLAESGSGGGAGATLQGIGPGTSGSGGAGGGFVDLTAQGNIFISGRIEAQGGKGGAGGPLLASGWSTYQPVTSGGGGGSGGGIRVLTPGSIVLGGTAVLTCAGGAGGIGATQSQSPSATREDGGNGGNGRVVLEDADSVIVGYGPNSSIPAEGSAGFFRGPFNSTRFVGGGLTPQLFTDFINIGPSNPTFSVPVQNYGIREDFIAGVPASGSNGTNSPAIFFELQGFSANPDGTPNSSSGTGWKSMGYFKDSGSQFFPTWVLGTPVVGNNPTALPNGQVPALPTGNTGGSIADVNLRQYLKLRITFFMKPTAQITDFGGYVDRWTLFYTYDQ